MLKLQQLYWFGEFSPFDNFGGRTMFDWNSFWNTALWTTEVIGLLISLYLMLYAIRLLAERDIFFTLANEGTTKAIMSNNKFDHFVMAYRNHEFKRSGDEIGWWDVVEINTTKSAPALSGNIPPVETDWWDDTIDPPQETQSGKLDNLKKEFIRIMKKPLSIPVGFVGGLRWVGIYPFATVHKFKMKWASIEQRAEKGQEPVIEYSPKDETISALLVRADIYALMLKNVEIEGGLPVSMVFAVRISIKNPYKALFRIEKWLEATLDQLGSELRRFFGNSDFDTLIGMQKDKSDLKTESEIEPIIRDILDSFGVEVEKIQILDLAPDNKFYELNFLVYEAEKKKKATITNAEAEADRVNLEYGAINSSPNGLYIKTLEAVGKAGTLILRGTNAGDLVDNFQVGGIKAIATPQTGTKP